MSKTNFLIMLLISGVLGSTAIAFNFARETRLEFEADRENFRAIAPPTQDDGQRQFSDAHRVRSSALSSTCRSFLSHLGDRLEKPGNERVVYTGTLQRSGETNAAPFTLTWELPGRLRLDDYGRQQITRFDGETVSRSDAASTSFDDELLETLIYDSAEHLFISQMKGAATRFLGSRFQLTDSEEDRASSVYDIFEVTEPSLVRPNSETQTRQYLFNSDTQVLELVRYRLSRNGSEVPVEVRLEGWRRSSGQLLPRRIVRFENGTAVITLTISAVAITPRVDDGFFVSSQPTR